MAYTTQYGLPQNVVNYLNQQLPTADIYGGITSVPFTFDDVAAEQQIEAQAATGLTPEQLLLLQRQNTGGDGPMGGGKFGNLDLSDLPVNMGVANEEDEESLVEEEPSGIQKLLKKVMQFAIPGLSFLENIAGGGQPYQQFTPGGTIRNGIYSIDGVNVPVSSFGGDFYNPNTGLNRFDRARNRFNETRSLKDLFGASRTLAEFNNARKILETQKKTGYKSDFMNRPKSERNYTGPGGGDNTGGDIGAKGAADSFSNKSGMGRTGY